MVVVVIVDVGGVVIIKVIKDVAVKVVVVKVVVVKDVAVKDVAVKVTIEVIVYFVLPK